MEVPLDGTISELRGETAVQAGVCSTNLLLAAVFANEFELAMIDGDDTIEQYHDRSTIVAYELLSWSNDVQVRRGILVSGITINDIFVMTYHNI